MPIELERPEKKAMVVEPFGGFPDYREGKSSGYRCIKNGSIGDVLFGEDMLATVGCAGRGSLLRTR